MSDPGYMNTIIESFERINSIRETNRHFDSCYSCKRLVQPFTWLLHESKLPFVSCTEFIRSKLSNLSALVSGESVHWRSVFSGGLCSLAVCVHWRSVFTDGLCSLAVCVHWRSVFTGGLCSLAVCVH